MAILREHQEGAKEQMGGPCIASLVSCAGTHLWYNPGQNSSVWLQFNGRQPSEDCAALL